MKTLPFILGVFLVMLSCTKDPIKLEKENYLIFGTFNGYCQENCTSLFKITETELFADDMSTFIFGEAVKFEEEALPNEKYDLAKEALLDFPDELTSSLDRSYGCPGCVDQDIIYLKYFDGADIYEWQVDTETEALPEFLRDYAVEIVELTEALLE